MTSGEAEAIYQRAGFGRDAGLGRVPGVLVVDFSRAFTDPLHPLGGEVTAQIEATHTVLASARAKHLPVLFSTIAFPGEEIETELWIRKVPALADLRDNSPLVEIDPRLGRREMEPVIVKRGASAFFGTNLAGMLAERGLDTLIVCGATTSGCVRATVVDALQNQLRAVVPRECVADRHPGPHASALFDIAAKYGSVVSVGEVLAYLDRVESLGRVW
jgi:maleamate amidohydrolase